jgi:hypothetical protein
MAGTEMKKVILVAVVILVAAFGMYQYNPYFFKRLMSLEGFEEKESSEEKEAFEEKSADAANPAKPEGFNSKKAEQFEDGSEESFEEKEGFADLSTFEGKANFSSVDAPAGCYPRDQLTPSELLPKDMNSVWAEQNPMGPGSLKGKNFLSAGALIGVNTVGQSLRNANLQVRSEPPNPQVAVSIFNQSTIAPDISHRPLEIGS